MEIIEPEIDYFIGLDLAQGGMDYTAIAVLQRFRQHAFALPEYTVVWLERWRDRRTARIPSRVREIYTRIARVYAQRVYAELGQIPTRPVDITLVVDQTGVGPFGLDPLRKEGLDPIGITIHGGDAVSHPDPFNYRVPKRDLAGAVHILLETHRLIIATSLEESAALKAELENFRAKINLKTGHDSYGAGVVEEWRVGAHDDLVLAVAVAAWMGESHPPPVLDPIIVDAWTDLPRSW